MRDIREALEHADDPCHDKLEKCFRYNGEDPAECVQCGGNPERCAQKQAQGYKPKLPETEYAFMLHGYIETFRPDPDGISWRDLEIHNAFLTVKNQHERKRLKRDNGS